MVRRRSWGTGMQFDAARFAGHLRARIGRRKGVSVVLLIDGNPKVLRKDEATDMLECGRVKWSEVVGFYADQVPNGWLEDDLHFMSE